MAAQFNPPPPPGGAPYGPRPSSPRGLYRTFGAPESLLRIHFPDDDPNKDNPKTSNPWYWFVKKQQVFYFSFLGQTWGPGWGRRAIFPVIKILQIDTQPMIPTPVVGYSSVEDAAKHWNGNTDLFGRFDERDQKFWDLIVQRSDIGKNEDFPFRQKPQFNVVKGQIQARNPKTDINSAIRTSIQKFNSNFNAIASEYNELASGVSPTGGFQYPGQSSPFNIPLPDGPPTTISHLFAQLNAFSDGPPYLQSAAYIGPVSTTAFFNFNTFTTQAMAFTINVGQFNPKKWNMSVFPPIDSTIIGNGSSSQVSKDYSGYSDFPFPPHAVEIM